MTQIFRNFSLKLEGSNSNYVQCNYFPQLTIFSGKQGSHVCNYGYSCFTHAMFNVLYRHTILDKGQWPADRNYWYRTCNRCYGAYISQVLNCCFHIFQTVYQKPHFLLIYDQWKVGLPGHCRIRSEHLEWKVRLEANSHFFIGPFAQVWTKIKYLQLVWVTLKGIENPS